MAVIKVTKVCWVSLSFKKERVYNSLRVAVFYRGECKVFSFEGAVSFTSAIPMKSFTTFSSLHCSIAVMGLLKKTNQWSCSLMIKILSVFTG